MTLQIEIDANEFKRLEANYPSFTDTAGAKFIAIGEVLLRYVRTKENIEKNEF